MTDNGRGDLPGVEHHIKISRRLIRQAGYELERRGDRVQASDKAAGAVAHAVKAVAEARYWRHDSHNRRRNIVDLLAAEYGLPDLTVMQDTADKLHDNFYEDTMQDFQVRDRLERVSGILETFTGLLGREPNPDFAPTGEQERALSRLRLSEEEIAEREAIDYPEPAAEFEEPEE